MLGVWDRVVGKLPVELAQHLRASAELQSLPLWAEVEALLADAVDDGGLQESIILAARECFCAAVQERAGAAGVPRAAGPYTDAAALEMLQLQGLRVGRGSAHGSNDCLSDSMLQVIAAAGLLGPDRGWSRRQRRELCAEIRRGLREQQCERLRPRQLTSRGIPDAAASDAEHARAYLQHHVHGRAILAFAAEEFDAAPLPAVELLVYTRWDGVHGSVDTTTLHEGEGEVVRLHLYNRTDENGTGYHYDPLLKSGGAGSEVSDGEDHGEDAVATGRAVGAAVVRAEEAVAWSPGLPVGVRVEGLCAEQVFEAAVAEVVAGHFVDMEVCSTVAAACCACAFRDCCAEFDTGEELMRHVGISHATVMCAAVAPRQACWPVCEADALAATCRACVAGMAVGSPPVAGVEQDRPCLRRFAEEIRTAQVVICFVCAGRHTRVAKRASASH